MTLFLHQTCTYLHGRADRFFVLVSNGQVAALSEWAYWLHISQRRSRGGATSADCNVLWRHLMISFDAILAVRSLAVILQSTPYTVTHALPWAWHCPLPPPGPGHTTSTTAGTATSTLRARHGHSPGRGTGATAQAQAQATGTAASTTTQLTSS